MFVMVVAMFDAEGGGDDEGGIGVGWVAGLCAGGGARWLSSKTGGHDGCLGSGPLVRESGSGCRTVAVVVGFWWWRHRWFYGKDMVCRGRDDYIY
ncbi:uncharacterized protein M6B38_341635 [Iris pallida]|uniref:Uncharacterized protein n=1 Tax=Iris pallida TaxID=29817 RepID=A0AAX6GWV0_IRIPA|nr:uncharacterized protein M6B38_341635 [Iris pallida]